MSKSFIKNIVVAINGSHSSVQAAMYAVIMAKQYACKVKFVYVVDIATIEFLRKCNFLVADEKNSYETDLTNNGKTYLDYAVNLALSKGVQADSELRKGSVVSELISAADEVKADMILLGGHETKENYIQKETIRHNVQATSRSEIVKFAHCPVLVIHKPDIEALFKIL